MFKPFDLAARSLLIVGGLNWLAVGTGKTDLVALATRSRFGRPNLASRTIYGIVGGAALWSLSRLIEQEAFPKRGKQGRRVREVMTPKPATVAPSTPIAEAARLLKQHDVGSLPVVDAGRLTGIVSDRDIALGVVADARDPGSMTVDDVASGNLTTVGPDQTLDDALHLMARKQVRRLPVVDENQLVGIIAQADMARHAGDAQVGETVEEISR